MCLAALLALVPFGLLVARFDWVCDDAFISFRYAKNLAHGHGLVWNPGETPRVEGYTNFLWVLLMAAVEFLRLDPTTWSRVLSLSSAVGLCLWVARFCQRRLDLGVGPLAGLLVFLGTLPPLVVWATSGLAALPVALCVFGVYERLFGDPRRAHGVQAGLLAVAASLLRSDAVAWLLMVLCLGLGTALLDRERRASLLKGVAWTAGLLILATAVHVVWRLDYYGDWLPNTARLKAVGGDQAARAMRLERGFKYALSFPLAVLSVALAPLLALPLLARRETRELVLHGLLVLGGTFAYAILAGGDFMAFGRFFVPAMPFVGLLVAALLRRGTPVAWIGTAACVALSLLPMFDLLLVPSSVFDALHFRWNNRVEKRQTELQRWRDMDRNAREWISIGRGMKLVCEPDESIVRGALGAIAYYSDLIVYDTYGLTNKHWQKIDPPVQRKSAGHDLQMNLVEDFEEFEPTYLGCLLLGDPEASPYSPFASPNGDGSDGEARFRAGYGELADLEVHELPEDQGFRPGHRLLLLRFRR